MPGLNAPLYVYVSRWFDRRRGSALALIASGQYISGALWPPIFESAIATYGWRDTMLVFGAVRGRVILPIALFALKSPPEVVASAASPRRQGARPTVLGWPPNLVFAMLALAAFCCCMPMSMPQSHLVALCSDLGIKPTHGAAMLSLLLGTAFVSRQMWGWISDRIGGLLTVLIGSAWQFCSIIALALTQDEIGLFTVTAIFGLGFSGIIPAYVLVVRELFPAREAGWRVPILLCLQRLRHGVGRLVRRPAVRSLRLLRAGLRGGADLQLREPGAGRDVGGAARRLVRRRASRLPTDKCMARLSDVRSVTPDRSRRRC